MWCMQTHNPYLLAEVLSLPLFPWCPFLCPFVLSFVHMVSLVLVTACFTVWSGTENLFLVRVWNYVKKKLKKYRTPSIALELHLIVALDLRGLPELIFVQAICKYANSDINHGVPLLLSFFSHCPRVIMVH